MIYLIIGVVVGFTLTILFFMGANANKTPEEIEQDNLAEMEALHYRCDCDRRKDGKFYDKER